jgi:RNA polymerase sigma factor (sigma-70 family)
MATLEINTLHTLSDTLKPFALRLTKDLEEANDLLQETMLKAIIHKDKFAEGTNLKAWLYTIMKNTFITNYQRVIRRNTFIDTTENLHYINSAENTTENSAYSEFAMQDIAQALNNLDENLKEPFVMHYRGFKYHEIAKRLNIPLGTVKNRIHIARKELKDSLLSYSPKN